MLIAVATLIVFAIAFLVSRRPWLLALVLLLAVPLLAGYAILAWYIGGAFLSGSPSRFTDVSFVLLFVIGNSIGFIFPIGMAIAALELLLWNFAGRWIELDSRTLTRRALSGIGMGAAIGLVAAGLLAISGPEYGDAWAAFLAVLTGTIDGLLIATYSRRLGFVSLGGVGGLVAAGVALFFWSAQPPSDAALQSRFEKDRPALEAIVVMMEENPHMTRIADDFLLKDDQGWPRAVGHGGISIARWDQYRAEFHQARLHNGTMRLANSSDVKLLVWSFGLVTGGSSVSYLHCGTPTAGLKHLDPPCQGDLDSGSGTSGEESYRFKRLTDRWFIYQESN